MNVTFLFFRTNVDIVLYHLSNLRNYGWEKIWTLVQDRHVLEYNEFAQLQLIVGFFKMSDLDQILPCDWNSRSTNCPITYKVVFIKNNHWLCNNNYCS